MLGLRYGLIYLESSKVAFELVASGFKSEVLDCLF